MKTEENKQKRELSDEELKQVTGGASIDCSLPENKDNIICNAKLRGLGEKQFETQYITTSFSRVGVIE